MTSETVRAAAAQPDLNHRDPRFAELLESIRAGLLGVYPAAEFDVFILGGSGTAGMEAMLTSIVGSGRALVLANGYYSERTVDILAAHGMPFDVVRFDWMKPIDLDRVEDALRHGSYEAVTMAHHETTTGRLNPVEALGSLARQYGAKLLVDAVSSFGADDLDLANVDALCATANKCLHGIPGVSFVMVRRGSLDLDAKPRSYYLHLPRYGGSRPPLTPPVPAMLALQQALVEFNEAGGQAARRSRYLALRDTMRQELERVGLSLAVDSAVCSCSLTTATIPPGRTYDQWFDENYREGFEIYGCKGDLAPTHFQASVMGELTDEHVSQWLNWVRSAIS